MYNALPAVFAPSVLAMLQQPGVTVLDVTIHGDNINNII